MKIILLSLVMLLIGFEPAFSGKILKKLNKELKKMKYQHFNKDFFARIGKNAVEIQSNADEIDSNMALIGNNTVEIAMIAESLCCDFLCAGINAEDGEVGLPVCLGFCEEVFSLGNPCAPLCDLLFNPGTTGLTVCTTACDIAYAFCSL